MHCITISLNCVCRATHPIRVLIRVLTVAQRNGILSFEVSPPLNCTHTELAHMDQIIQMLSFLVQAALPPVVSPVLLLNL